MASRSVQLRIPPGTLLQVLATAVLVWALVRLWPYLLALLLCVLVAVALDPVVAWLMRRMKRGAAVGLVALVMLAAVALFVGVLVPAIGHELQGVVEGMPAIRQRTGAAVQGSSPLVERIYRGLERLPSSPAVQETLDHPERWGLAVLEGVAGVVVMLVMTLYLLLDGRRLYAWLLAYVPRARRERVAQTSDEVSRVIHAYIRGQAITSALVGAFSYATLKVLHVPAPLALAVLAALLDVVPFVGFVAFTLPAVVLALTVSPTVALVVAALYGGYHFLENYVIVPRVYGRQLRLSTLTVLLALGVAGALFGVLAAILVLPLVAAYPVVERLWLHPWVGGETLEDHAALDRSLERKDERTPKDVIEGEKPRG